MSALAAPDDDDRPRDETDRLRRLLFWERQLFIGQVLCHICCAPYYDWLDVNGLVWRMCSRCDVDPARTQPPTV